LADKIFVEDSAVLEASIDFDDPQLSATAVDVNWAVVKPDGTTLASTVSTILTGNDVTGIISGPDIDQVGLWRARAKFDLDDGTTRSVLINFEVVDPLAPIAQPGDNTLAWVIDHAWMKLEDLFDSELGGPYLDDRTMKNFSRDKLLQFVPDALYVINNDSQPVTTFDDTTFPLQQHKALLAQGVLVESIYQLMRSYVEQPNPVGQAITYFDRRDYLQRWQSVLTLEEQKFQKLIDIFKLQYLGFGSSAILIGGYASSLVRTPAAYRSRYPRYVMPYRAI
jgi:hypothetical protein